MHFLRGSELPDPEGNAWCRAARAEEVLQARAEARSPTRNRGRSEPAIGRGGGERSSPSRPFWSSRSLRPFRYERSSIGRAPVSKTGGWGFDSLRSCSACLRGLRSAPSRSVSSQATRSGAMGKVKDGLPASKPVKVAKGGTGRGFEGPVRAVPGEPGQGPRCLQALQGRQARLWTAIGLGLIVVLRAPRGPRVAQGPDQRRSGPGASGGDRGGPGLADVPASPVPAFRRVPDRDRSRDEQGLLDQSRRFEAGDNGRPSDGRP